MVSTQVHISQLICGGPKPESAQAGFRGLPLIVSRASQMAKDLLEYADHYTHASMDDTVLLPTQATQLAHSTGLVSEKVTATFWDQK